MCILANHNRLKNAKRAAGDGTFFRGGAGLDVVWSVVLSMAYSSLSKKAQEQYPFANQPCVHVMVEKISLKTEAPKLLNLKPRPIVVHDGVFFELIICTTDIIYKDIEFDGLKMPTSRLPLYVVVNVKPYRLAPT
jgi:hypothetical protein